MSLVQSRMMILSVAVFLQAFVFSAAEGADPKPPPVSDSKLETLTEEDGSLSLLKAAEAGDIARFDKEMERLLLGPYSHWAKALFAKDRLGQNLFHKMAQLKRQENQKAFAERMKKIIELVFIPSAGSRLFRRDNERDYSLSGVHLFQQGGGESIYYETNGGRQQTGTAGKTVGNIINPPRCQCFSLFV